MKVITYFPKTVEAKEELAKRVAEVHARAVVDCVKQLPLDSKEQGILLGEIMN